MKKFISFAIVSALLLALFSLPVFADDPIINFPDPNFKAAVLAALGKSPTYKLTKSKAAEITSLDVSKSKISDLSGIKHFTSLRTCIHKRQSVI